MRNFRKRDYLEFCSWFEARGQKAPPYEFLPEYGLIIPKIAAGFLIQTDCGFGILDFFITNKDAAKQVRADALHDISHKLCEAAKLYGLKYVKCDTRYENIKDLAIRLRFSYYGESASFAKEL